mmetsp:Transcript_9483/g.24120  ORF Transcript_9483/g.24120 Transcript_9483/m.24120 type:complete len:215 (-) Transcript_9483:786-1430(-)
METWNSSALISTCCMTALHAAAIGASPSWTTADGILTPSHSLCSDRASTHLAPRITKHPYRRSRVDKLLVWRVDTCSAYPSTAHDPLEMVSASTNKRPCTATHLPPTSTTLSFTADPFNSFLNSTSTVPCTSPAAHLIIVVPAAAGGVKIRTTSARNVIPGVRKWVFTVSMVAACLLAGPALLLVLAAAAAFFPPAYPPWVAAGAGAGSVGTST